MNCSVEPMRRQGISRSIDWRSVRNAASRAPPPAIRSPKPTSAPSSGWSSMPPGRFGGRFLENPQRVRRKLHVIELVLERRRCIGTQRKLVTDEKELPPLADIHLGLERHGNPVRARPAPQHHLLEADDAGRRVSDR